MDPAPRTRTPSQGRAVRTRAALVAAAAKEFAASGYAATTAKRIAARAGAATGSFYQYFTDKDALLRELAASRQDALVEGALAAIEAATPPGGAALSAIAGAVRAQLAVVVAAVVDYHAADPGLHAVITERRHADPGLDALITAGERRLLARITALLARWGHVGDPTATAFILLATLEGAVHAHVLGHPVVDDTTFAAALADALFRIALPAPKEHPWPS
jgi:AcrR family transcriptional regulator